MNEKPRSFAFPALNKLRNIAVIALCFAPFVFAQSASLTTSAEYIVRFVRYVHWDGEDKAEAWRICIAPGVPLDLDRIYTGEIVRGKKFAIRHIVSGDAISTCHVLDLSGADAASEAVLLQRVRHLPILTVGRDSKFCSEGGQVCLHLSGGEQKFDINLGAVKDSGLNISARLLMLGASRSGGTTEGP